ncbi:MAG: hypothetical protein ACSLE7_04880 [Mycobacterium sp.]
MLASATAPSPPTAEGVLVALQGCHLNRALVEIAQTPRRMT